MSGPRNPSAFPCLERGSAGAGHLDLTDPGMTLRDYFAAKAMDSLIAGAVRGHIDYGNEGDVARRAYEFADAMLKAREVQP